MKGQRRVQADLPRDIALHRAHRRGAEWGATYTGCGEQVCPQLQLRQLVARSQKDGRGLREKPSVVLTSQSKDLRAPT